mmetsp:Transcript_19912/g.66328  ORF Transcript_19912/g.66328 Transcript_19912/m.66328 type:complete len:109 (+) Transcript_19912:1343-1669(+)
MSIRTGEGQEVTKQAKSANKCYHWTGSSSAANLNATVRPRGDELNLICNNKQEGEFSHALDLICINKREGEFFLSLTNRTRFQRRTRIMSSLKSCCHASMHITCCLVT